MANEPDELQTLKDLSKGLSYPSESDAPVTVFHWPASAGKNARAAVLANVERGTPIESCEPSEFFSAVEGTSQAEGFRKLRRAMESAFFDLVCIRAGEVRVTIFVFGRVQGGGWAGIRTEAVET